MTRTWKILLAVLIVIGLLVAALYLTSPAGTEFHLQRPTSNTVPDRAHWRLNGWHLKVRKHAHRVASRGGCPYRWEASAHTWAGSSWFHEIVSFDSRINWCGTGGGMRDPHVYITPDNARLLWHYEGVVASSQGHTSGAHCGPYPQPECMFFERHVQYSRAIQGVGLYTTPKIRWQVTGSGGCLIQKPSGEWEGCNR